MPDTSTSGLQLQSTVKSNATVELTLVDVPVPEPRDDQVVVRIEAAPINPSDMGALFGPADLSTARASTEAGQPVITADLPQAQMGALAARLDQPIPAGNECGGVVVGAGSSDEAQALIGRTVGIIGGAMYAQYRVIAASACLVLPEGVTPVEGASCFVNPLTALGMIETMRLDGHTALVHTAAASNLGQMLQRACIADGVDLVNVVRRPEHVTMLREQGAKYVVDSSADSFLDDLTDALEATGATVAFDATGGGRLASDLLTQMEAAISRSTQSAAANRYGSNVHKQVYIYGGLDTNITTLNRNFGMAWGIGGFLLGPFQERVGPDAMQKLRERVAEEITTTFASSYSHEVSLAGALTVDAVQAYGARATGRKYLVRPALEK
jgi:NADPH2:quinone reductase